MAYDALLKINKTVTENETSDCIKYYGRNALVGRIDVLEASGQLTVVIEESPNAVDFSPVKEIYNLVGVIGKSKGDLIESMIFYQTRRSLEYTFKPNIHSRYVRYRFEVAGDSPSFDIEINHSIGGR